jgi:hypothetical protein
MLSVVLRKKKKLQQPPQMGHVLAVMKQKPKRVGNSQGGKHPEKGGAKKPLPWSVRPPADVRALMKEALNATGSNRNALIIQVVREKLPEVVAEWIARSEEARRRFRPSGAPEDKTKRKE